MSDQPKSRAEEYGVPPELLNEAAKTTYGLLESGYFDQAIEYAQGLVAADESNSYYRQLLAAALIKKKLYKRAHAVLDEGLKNAPGDRELTRLKGTIPQIPPR